MKVSELHPGPYPPTGWAAPSLVPWWSAECGGQSSDLFCITLQDRRGVTTPATFGSSINADVFLIIKKNVALAQMTFSHHHVLIAQCHKDPPPLLSYLGALMSSHAIKYEPDNYNLEQIQMPCVVIRIKWSQIWFFLFFKQKIEIFVFFNCTLGLKEAKPKSWRYRAETHFAVTCVLNKCRS